MEILLPPESSLSTDLFLAAAWAAIAKNVTKEVALTHVQQLDQLQCTSFTVAINDPRTITNEDWIALFNYTHTLDNKESNENALDLYMQYREIIDEMGEEEDAQFRYCCALSIYPGAMCVDLHYHAVE